MNSAASSAAAPAARGELLAYLLLPVVPALLSLNILGARLGAGEVPPLATNLWRWVFGAAAVLPIVAAVLWRERHVLRREWRDLVLLGTVGMGCSSACVFLGAETTTAINMGLLFTGAPIMIVILAAIFLGERLTGRRTAGVAIALSGVLVILSRGDPAILLSLRFTTGDLWILASAASWAAYSVLLKQRKSALGTLPRLCVLALVGIVASIPLAVGEHLAGRPMLWSWHGLGLVLLVAIPAGIMAYAVYGYVVGRLGPGRAGIVLYLNPVCASLYAWAILDERLHWFHWLGAALVLPGIFLATRPARPAPQTP